MAQQYEYKILHSAPGKKLEELLNLYASEGYKVLAISPLTKFVDHMFVVVLEKQL